LFNPVIRAEELAVNVTVDGMLCAKLAGEGKFDYVIVYYLSV